jgi:hypothetical protein
MEIVNGFVCLTCSDVAKAKRNIDPAANPLQPQAKRAASVQAGTDAPGAKDASGAKGALDAKGALGVNQPRAAGMRGTQVNLLL